MERKALLFLFSLILSPLYAIEAGKVAGLLGKATANGKLLYLDEAVAEGDLIATSKGSRLKLLMKDQSVLDIGPASHLTIGMYESVGEVRKVDLNLKYGSVRALIAKKSQQAKNKFNFKTKWGVMAIRGTEFFVSARSPENFEVTVFEGALQVETMNKATATAPILLGYGKKLQLKDYAAVMKGEGVPQITAVSGNELATLRQNVMFKDATFIATVDENQPPRSADNNKRELASAGIPKPSTAQDRATGLSSNDVAGFKPPSSAAVISDPIIALGNPQSVANSAAPGGSATGGGSISAGGTGGVGGSSGDPSPVTATTSLTVILDP